MLKTRVITALVMLGILIPALFLLPPRAWAMLMLVVVAAAGWEWGRLCGFKPVGAVLLGLLVAASAGALLLLSPAAAPESRSPVEEAGETLIYLASAVWFLVIPLWFRWRRHAPKGIVLAALGWLLLLACWYAVWKFRETGALYLFLLMGTVWIADMAAYAAGRRFGRRKLAPAISPGKTWEGVAGAVVGVQVYAILLLLLESAAPAWFANYFGSLAARLGVGGTLLAALLLTAVSVVGDLFESLLKRRVNLKDSSGLLPGHGGVLDRIDALISTLPVAFALVALIALASH
ncbi:MAG TPA: CDP-archaeol synthase [Burkholderiales bacterium]|jgi:phosphatidate cytidylyltransferase|nr:CDP-archaeol synthase [Burkholderiales bacterium]